MDIGLLIIVANLVYKLLGLLLFTFHLYFRGASGDTVAGRLNNDVGGLSASCLRSPLDNAGNIIEDESLAVGY